MTADPAIEIPGGLHDHEGFLAALAARGLTIGAAQHRALAMLMLRLGQQGIRPATPREMALHLAPLLAGSAREAAIVEEVLTAQWHAASPSPRPGPEVARTVSAKAGIGHRVLHVLGYALPWLAAFCGFWLVVYLLRNQGQPGLGQSAVPGGGPGGQDDPQPPTEIDLAAVLVEFLPVAYVLTPLVIAIAFIAWRRLRPHGLSRAHTLRDPVLEAHRFEDDDARLFRHDAATAAIRTLARQYEAQSTWLDLRGTILATIRKGGLFSPRTDTRPRTPEYVLLSEWRNPSDHLAWMAGRFGDALREAGAPVHHYAFAELGRSLITVPEAGGRAQVATFEALMAHGGSARLILFCDASTFLHNGVPHAWLTALQGFDQIALLTARPETAWGEDEAILTAMGIGVHPLDAAGIYAAGLRVSDAEGALPGVPDGPGNPDPARWFEQSRQRWTGDRPPPDTEVEAAVEALSHSLGPQSFLLLAATAAYGEIRPELTHRLMRTLFPGERNEDILFGRIGRLLWLREGRMPDWMRSALLAALPPAAYDRVYDALAGILARPLEEGGIALSVARDGRWTVREVVLRLLRDRDARAMRDSVFLEGMRRVRASGDRARRQVRVGTNPIARLLRVVSLGEAVFLATSLFLTFLFWKATTGSEILPVTQLDIRKVRAFVEGAVLACLAMTALYYLFAPLEQSAWRDRIARWVLFVARSIAVVTTTCALALMAGDQPRDILLFMLALSVMAVTFALQSSRAAPREIPLRTLFDGDAMLRSLPLLLILWLPLGGVAAGMWLADPTPESAVTCLTITMALAFVLPSVRRRLELSAVPMVRVIVLVTAVAILPYLLVEVGNLSDAVSGIGMAVTFAALGMTLAHLLAREGLATPKAGRVTLLAMTVAAGLAALPLPEDTVPLGVFADSIAYMLGFYGLAVLSGAIPPRWRALDPEMRRRLVLSLLMLGLIDSALWLWVRSDPDLAAESIGVLAVVMSPVVVWPLLKWVAQGEPLPSTASGFVWSREGSRWIYLLIPVVTFTCVTYQTGPWSYSATELIFPLALLLGAYGGARGYATLVIGALPLVFLPFDYSGLQTSTGLGLAGYLALLVLCRFSGSTAYRTASFEARDIPDRQMQFLCYVLTVQYGYVNSFGDFNVGVIFEPWLLMFVTLFCLGTSRISAGRVLGPLALIVLISWFGVRVLQGSFTFPRFSGFQVVPALTSLSLLQSMLLFFLGGRILRRYIADRARMSSWKVLMLSGIALYATLGQGVSVSLINKTFDDGLKVNLFASGPNLYAGALFLVLLCLAGWRGILASFAIYGLAVTMWNFAGRAILRAAEGPRWRIEPKILDNNIFYGFEREGYVQFWPGTEPVWLWIRLQPYDGGLGFFNYDMGPGYSINMLGWTIPVVGIFVYRAMSRRYRDPAQDALTEITAAGQVTARFGRYVTAPVVKTQGYERPFVWIGGGVLAASAAFTVVALIMLVDIFVFDGGLAGYGR